MKHQVIQLDENITLAAPSAEDVKSYVKYLNEEEIFKRTLMIPFPYSEKDAKDFIAYAKNKSEKYGRPMEWAIKSKEGEVIGGIGLHGRFDKDSHKDEIGYWMAKPFWGKGVMTKALKKISEIATDEYGLLRIEAPIFAFNLHSVKVAEKCGYKFEGLLKKAYLKNGHYFDCKLYALVK